MERARGPSSAAWVLALDVDGVLLDPERGGEGHWTNELDRRHGIARTELRDAFFARRWDDVVNGRCALETALGEALADIGTDVTTGEVIACWFAADFVPIAGAVELARRADEAGVPVVLATNQEHRRAAYLRDRFSQEFAVADVIYSAALGVQKHESAFFTTANDRLDVDDPSTVIFVDDDVQNIEQARRAGWTVVHASADGVWIDDVSDLLWATAR